MSLLLDTLSSSTQAGGLNGGLESGLSLSCSLGPWDLSGFLLECQSVEHQFWFFWPFDSTCSIIIFILAVGGGSKTYLDFCR